MGLGIFKTEIWNYLPWELVTLNLKIKSFPRCPLFVWFPAGLSVTLRLRLVVQLRLLRSSTLSPPTKCVLRSFTIQKTQVSFSLLWLVQDFTISQISSTKNKICNALLNFRFAADTTALKKVQAFWTWKLQKLEMWLRANKLEINTTKTKIIVFHPMQKNCWRFSVYF